MILDIAPPIGLLPLIFLIGLVFVLMGREVLEVLSFAIGAIAGGVIAYMILRGLLYAYDDVIPLYVEMAVAAVMIFGGGMLGRGAMATMLAMASALIFADVIHAVLGPELLLVTVIVCVVLFSVFVALIQKYVMVFSSFLGGAIISIALTAIPLDDLVLLRIMQLALALVLTIIGSIVQYRIKKWKDTRGEKVVWVPTA